MAKAGAPKKYKNAGALAEKVNAYFDAIPLKNGTFKRPPSVAGLCLYLGVTRQTLLNYEKGEDEAMAYVVQGAKLIIEDYWSGQLAGKFANGAKFALGSGFGWNGLGAWSDKSTERERDTGEGGVIILAPVEQEGPGESRDAASAALNSQRSGEFAQGGVCPPEQHE